MANVAHQCLRRFNAEPAGELTVGHLGRARRGDAASQVAWPPCQASAAVGARNDADPSDGSASSATGSKSSHALYCAGETVARGAKLSILEPVGLLDRRLQIDRSGPFFTAFLAHSSAMRAAKSAKTVIPLGSTFAFDAQSPTRPLKTLNKSSHHRASFWANHFAEWPRNRYLTRYRWPLFRLVFHPQHKGALHRVVSFSAHPGAPYRLTGNRYVCLPVPAIAKQAIQQALHQLQHADVVFTPAGPLQPARRTMSVDCNAIWFDQWGRVRSSPQTALALFQLINERGGTSSSASNKFGEGLALRHLWYWHAAHQ